MHLFLILSDLTIGSLLSGSGKLMALWELHISLFMHLHRTVSWKCFFLIWRLQCRFRKPELHNPDEPVQRTPIPGKSLLCSFQAIRLPFCWSDQWPHNWLCLDHVQLHQPLWQISSWSLCQWMQRREGRSWLQCGDCGPTCCYIFQVFRQRKWCSEVDDSCYLGDCRFLYSTAIPFTGVIAGSRICAVLSETIFCEAALNIV